jgi:large subunit ribosomal protein L31
MYELDSPTFCVGVNRIHRKDRIMKDGIHPKYQDSVVVCGCGNTFTTRSTKPKIMVEVCSKCHPYFTGSVKFVDAAGRVDKFNKKFQGTYGKAKKAAVATAAAAPTENA